MKKYLVGLFAIVLAIGFSAFTANKSFDTRYFVFDGTSNSQLEDISFWHDAGLSDPSASLPCGTQQTVCYVESDNVDFSTTFASAIVGKTTVAAIENITDIDVLNQRAFQP